MKTLLVMRHAKSDWGAASGHDHDRALAPRGIKAARRMGRALRDSDMVPDLVISSTAVRARTTAELAAEAGGWKCAIETSSDLYASEPLTVLEVVSATDESLDRLLIAGHEPTSSSLIGWLIGGGSVHMPTAAIACLEFENGGWSDLSAGSCDLRWLITPKMLKEK
jgi:phosphohistidine phosphatase